MKKTVLCTLIFSLVSPLYADGVSKDGKVIAPLVREFLQKNIKVEDLKKDVEIIELNDQLENESRPWMLNLSGLYTDDNRLNEMTGLERDTWNKVGKVGLSKSFFSGTDLKFESEFKDQNENSLGTQSLSLSQDLAKNFFGVNDRIDLKISKINVERGHANYSREVLRQIVEFYSVYLDISLKKAKLEFAEESLKRAQDRTKLISSRVRRGIREKVDLYQVKMNERTNLENVYSSKRELNNVRTDFNQLLSRNVSLDEIIDLKEMNIAGTPLPTPVFDNTYDLKILNHELQNLKYELEQKENSLLPSLKLVGQITNNAVDPSMSHAFSDSTIGNSNKALSTGIVLSWDIGSKQARINRSKIRAEKMFKESSIKNARMQFDFDIENFKNNAKLIDEQIKSSREKISLAKKVLREYEKLYNQGRDSLDHIIDAETSLITAENSFVTYLYLREVLATNFHYYDNSLQEYLENR